MNNKLKSIILSIGLMLLLSGCDQMVVLNPKGIVGEQEKQLIIDAVLLMLIVVVPVIILTFVFAWKYRASNTKAKYDPTWHHSNTIEAICWGVPIAIIAVLATITWRTTHTLDPYRPLQVPEKPMTIEVVALDWKWLFIYPEENIATVNFLEFPAGTPVDFKVTADAPMNSFMIPQLGGQIYAMAGMQTHLHLIADEVGDYAGRAVSYSGHGFSGMTFTARASTREDYEAWVKKVKQSPETLSANEYYKLVKPSYDNPPAFYSTVQNHLYDNIIMKYMMPGMEDLSVDHSSMMHM